MDELWNVRSIEPAKICTMLYDSMGVKHLEIVIDMKAYGDEK